MKKVFLCCLCSLAGLLAVAQQKSIRQVENACEELRLLMINPDSSRLAMITDDSLSYGHSGGHIDSKPEFIEKLMSKKSDFVSIKIADQKIVVRDHTAFVRHDLTAETMDGGKPGSVHLGVLQVWIRKSGKWKLAARQAVKAT